MFFQKVEAMRVLLTMLLSLIFLTSAVSAIVITEIDDEQAITPVSINPGENISVSIIREELKEIKTQLLTDIDESVSAKIEEFEEKILAKIGLGFLSLALFMFNLALAKKLLIDMVFKDG